MPVTTGEIIAYIGAAAWIPQIVTWCYRAYITPKIQIVASRTATVGYTRFGPIFNLNLAFTSHRKAALIELLEAEVEHENGERRVFQMAGMSESMSDIADAAGNKTTVSKEQQTLAFKIGTESLLERFVRFQEDRFHSSLEPVIQKGAEKVQFERKNGPDYFNRLSGAKEFHDILSFHDGYFWWKAGRYKVNFAMKSPNRFKLRKRTFTFVLNQLDVEALRANMVQLRNDYENVVRSGEDGYTFKPVSWNWRAIKFEGA